MDRNTLGRMSDLALQTYADGCRGRLERDWSRGQPGRLVDCFSYSVALLEAEFRGVSLRPPLHGQMTISEAVFDAEWTR